jgi:hypothetical protein
MLDTLKASTFNELESKRFKVFIDESDSVDLEMARVDDLEPTPRQERFSVIFRGPHERFVPQGSYKMENEQLGTLELFIVPIARDEDGFYYEAAFNRIIEK